MNAKMIEGALGMLARLIPPEEYAKAVAAIGELTALLKSIDARARSIDEGVAHCVKHIDDLGNRLASLETAAMADSPTFSAMGSELALWLVPGSIEKAMAPSRGDPIDAAVANLSQEIARQ